MLRNLCDVNPYRCQRVSLYADLDYASAILSVRSACGVRHTALVGLRPGLRSFEGGDVTARDEMPCASCLL